MQKFLIVALSVSLVVPTAVLAQSALAPGKPAGVHAAQMDRTTALVGVGAVAVLAGIAAAASNCCKHDNTQIATVPIVTTV